MIYEIEEEKPIIKVRRDEIEFDKKLKQTELINSYRINPMTKYVQAGSKLWQYLLKLSTSSSQPGNKVSLSTKKSIQTVELDESLDLTSPDGSPSPSDGIESEDKNNHSNNKEGASEKSHTRGEKGPRSKRGDRAKPNFEKLFYSGLNSSQGITNDLISNFIKRNYINKKSKLNNFAGEPVVDDGYNEWDYSKILFHTVSKQYSQLKNDKFSYQTKPQNSDKECLPIIFYFDMSASMEKHLPIIMKIAYYVVRSNAKVVLGFNEIFICEYSNTKSKDEKEIINEMVNMFCDVYDSGLSMIGGDTAKNIRVKIEENDYTGNIKIIKENMNKYITANKPELTVYFSDGDILRLVQSLSEKTQSYYFDFSRYVDKEFNRKYKGWRKYVYSEQQIMQGFKEIIENNERKENYNDREF